MSDIAAVPPGTRLPLTVVRGGERLEMTIELGERPTPAPRRPDQT